VLRCVALRSITITISLSPQLVYDMQLGNAYAAAADGSLRTVRDAVTNSCVVVLCVSEGMKEDMNCYALMSYAKLQGDAKFFFLEMQEGVVIDGWVEALLGKKRGMQVGGWLCLLLSACRLVGLSACRLVGLSACRLVGLSACRLVGLSACRLVAVAASYTKFFIFLTPLPSSLSFAVLRRAAARRHAGHRRQDRQDSGPGADPAQGAYAVLWRSVCIIVV
jgi:hypothetical protein